MEDHSNVVRRSEKRQRHDEHDNEEEADAAIVRMASKDARRVARTLEDGLLFRIAEFLNPTEAAVVCKSFLEAATKTSASLLKRIENNHRVDADWRLRLSQHVLDCYKRFYFGGGGGGDAVPPNQQQIMPPRAHPTLHPRLLCQFADKFHLVHHGELLVFTMFRRELKHPH